MTKVTGGILPLKYEEGEYWLLLGRKAKTLIATKTSSSTHSDASDAAVC